MRGIWELSVLSAFFFCKFKTVLKYNIYLKKYHEVPLNTHKNNYDVKTKHINSLWRFGANGTLYTVSWSVNSSKYFGVLFLGSEQAVDLQ